MNFYDYSIRDLFVSNHILLACRVRVRPENLTRRSGGAEPGPPAVNNSRLEWTPAIEMMELHWEAEMMRSLNIYQINREAKKWNEMKNVSIPTHPKWPNTSFMHAFEKKKTQERKKKSIQLAGGGVDHPGGILVEVIGGIARTLTSRGWRRYSISLSLRIFTISSTNRALLFHLSPMFWWFILCLNQTESFSMCSCSMFITTTEGWGYQ